MIGQTFSHYRIIKEVGKGGMGVVYLAEDTELDRQVAIKVSTEADGPRGQQLRMRFRREMRVIAKLSHRNIATVHDAGTTPDGQLYIVMELVQGKVLSDLIEEKSLTLEWSVEIISDVASALAEAHRQGIVHRDIKPSNIAINEQGDVKVLDFGLAKYLDDAVAANQLSEQSVDQDGHQNEHPSSDPARQAEAQTPTRTRAGVILCTPEYASPEQAMGLETDARTDLFSLGSVLYECLTGTRPFSAAKPNDVRTKVIHDDPPPPSALNSLVSSELDRIALKALAKKREARYQTAAEFAVDLFGTKTKLQQNAAVREQDEVPRQVTAPAGIATSSTTFPSPPTGWFSTITNAFTQLHIPVIYVIIAAVGLGLISWGAWRLLGAKAHQPRAEAARLYDRGVDAMHEGAFFRASKMLQEAIQIDDRFALAHARLAEALTELDYSDQAKDHLYRARELIPDPSILPYLDRLRFQAVTAVVKRDFAKAITDYQALVEAVPDFEKQHALTDLGRAYEKNDQLDKAIESYEAAIKKDPNYAAAFLRLGVVYNRRQRFAEATAAFDQAYKLFNINGDLEGIAEVALQRAVLFTQQGKVSEAGDQLLKALEKASALENQDKRIKILLNLSNNSIVAGRAEDAQRYSTEAVLLAQNNKMENLTTQGLIDIGNAYMLKANYVEAEKNFNEALRLAQLYKGGRSEARALLSLASLRTHQNDPAGAHYFFARALPFYQLGGYRKELAQAYSILGHAFDQAGLYEQALGAFQQQLDLARKVGDQQQIGSSDEGLGVVLNHQQRYSEALMYFSEQYTIFNFLRNKLIAGYAAMNKGTMLWQLGRYDEAHGALQEASIIAENKGHEPYKELLGWIQVSNAQLRLSQRDFPGAIAESRNALKTAGTELKAIAIQAKYALGLAQSASGQVGEGRKHCQEAVDLAKSLSDPLPLSHALLALAEAALAAGDTKTARNTAQQARERFATAKQHASEWRAWVVEAQGSFATGDLNAAGEAASQAATLLEKLKEEWGSDGFATYSSRPDVQIAREKLNRPLPKHDLR